MTKEEQNALVLECRASGKSIKAWCAGKGIPYTTYINWARRIPWEKTEGVPVVSVGEVVPAETQKAASPIKWAGIDPQAAVKPSPEATETVSGSHINISCGRFELRIPEGVNAELLSDVLWAVNEICC